ncbi:MAG TPA: replicative DNA helicase [Gemmatimonadaceae bacterium]|nr:replicative DNA helicase [Gemmatimonadaceae bacterium]
MPKGGPRIGAGRKPKARAVVAFREGLASPPAWLTPAAKTYYRHYGRQLEASRVITHADRDALAMYAATLADLAVGREDVTFTAIGETVVAASRRLAAISAGETAVPGTVRTGYGELDTLTRGLAPGSLTILAARPSMGKTGFAVNVARRVAGQGLPVGVFSLEQSAEELTWRALFAEAHVNGHVTMQGYASDADQAALGAAMETVGALPIWLHDGAGLTLPEMRAQARRLQARHGLALVVIDYLQLIEPSGRYESRTAEVTALSRGAKALARDLKVPVLCLSQLSRDLEKRPLADRRPRLSDLRDSGAIEQDADNVWFLYREAVYQKTFENESQAELIVSKNRNGPLGTVDLWFHGAEFRFEEAA